MVTWSYYSFYSLPLFMTTVWRFRNFECETLIPALVEIPLYSGYLKPIIGMSVRVLHVLPEKNEH